MEPDNRGLVNPDIRRLKGTLGAVQTLNNTKAGHIINQAAKMFSEHMVDKNFDVIGTIKTMKTNLAGDLVDKIDFSDGRKPMVLKNLLYLTKTRDDIKTTSETVGKKVSRLFKYGDFDIEKIGKEDKANVKGFLGVNPSLENRIMGKNVAIIDDYAETGTTLREACDELLRCGAKSVSGYAILK
jgi:pyrimidine operon attenuation protein/uracil phosphoribosyltransferase